MSDPFLKLQRQIQALQDTLERLRKADVPSGSGGAPTDADYWVETANSSLSNEVVVGTTGITTAAYASRQAAAKAGRLFLPNNSAVIERDTGSAWSPWGPIFPLTAPVDGDYAWINQGSATVSTTNGGIYLEAPTDASFGVHVRKKSAPTPPYTITALFLPNAQITNYPGFGLCWRESGSGKLVTLLVQLDGASNTSAYFISRKLDNATTINANYAVVNAPLWSQYWLQMSDDNTNRIMRFSSDGIHWQQIDSAGRTDFITADEVGFFVNPQSAAYPVGAWLLSWKET